MAHKSPSTGPRQTRFQPECPPRLPRDGRRIPMCNVNPEFELRNFGFEINIFKKNMTQKYK